MKRNTINIENRKESLKQVHDNIINAVLMAFSAIAFLSLVSSLSRGYQTGWKFNHVIHAFLFLILFIIAVFRNRISANVKSIFVIMSFVAISVTGLLSIGLLSAWLPCLLTAIVLALIFFGKRFAVIITVLVMIFAIVIGVLYQAGLYSFNTDFNIYHKALSTWLAFYFAAMMFAAIIISNLDVLHKHLFAMADTLDTHRRDLQASNEELQAMNEAYEEQSEELLNTQIDLMEKEELYRAVFESANDSIILLNSEGIIYQSNRKTDELFGENVDGKYPWDLSPELQPDGKNSREKGKEIFYIVLNRVPQRLYWLLQRRDGTLIDAEVSLSPMKAGNTDFILGIVRDLTDQKKLEKQLVQTQKMETVGTLTSGLAHDFNNILGAIMGGVTLIERNIQDIAGGKEDRARKYIDIVMKASSRASGIISQLMNLSRNREEVLLPVDLNQSLENVIKIIQNSFPKSVSIEYQKFEEPAVIKGEQTQIEQVLLNLCINASHAMTIMRPPEERQGGILSVSIDYMDASGGIVKFDRKALEGENYFVIKVTDAGVGMSDEVKARLFDPFFTTKAKGTGTGLGLSMVYNIIKNHNGFITVYSEPGAGSTFHVYLPVMSREDNEKGLQIGKKQLKPGSGNILVVDDEMIQRVIIEGMLRECGYTVTMTSSGDEALKLYEKNRDSFDLVITDLSMKEMDGLELYMKMKSINKDIKVVITSGFRLDPRIEKGLAMGIRRFIEKPFSLIGLSETVHEAIHS